MSSFRIDRQYVSFQTAETQPIRATREFQKPKQEPAAGPEKPGLDLSGIYNEIYERLRREHAEQAENMLSKAAEEAREIVEKAKKDAAEILAGAESDAARLKEELTAAVENAARERKSREERELRDIISSLRKSYDDLVEGMKNDVVGLVMEIARKVIGIKLSQSDEVFIGLVKDALERLKQTGSVVIRVSPEDYARYFGNGIRPELDAGEMKIAVAEEPDFKVGDLVVESEGEIVDLSVDRQLNRIEEAFLS